MQSIVSSAAMAGALSSVMLAGSAACRGAAEVTMGWHGDRYRDGHRNRERHDWEARHPRGRDDQRPQW
ncbi:hypothetical protein [Burkholderia latens]|uniref:Lipoprotein n=1 Tax=Burkholderia latens TaxID=488446 RepID=A0A6H9SYN1_9BURK|nr:hypothetical protein [Burkholderia latens]KAB0643512.1 hypothetical protein F7R21_06585 [Burkholderia latens]VWB32954.1 lipoprotein [Burkholderia latens]